MKRHGALGGFSGLLACGAIFAAWLGGCYNASESEVPAVRGGQTASGTVDGGTDIDSGCCAGLPCDVAALLQTSCQSCHSAHPSAPMALVTYDDLHAPARSDSTKKVYELALERMSSAAKPMPPGGQLRTDEIAVFSAWATAGAPKTRCTTNTDAAVGTECTVASDCPGVLVCRSGTCDVECVNDKDCTASWTCEDTRCVPPTVTAAPYYNAVTAATAWSSMNLTAMTTDSYSGTVFDSRYVYFAPRSTGPALRYDTQLGFSSARAWTSFDLKTLNAAAQAYSGAVFDGRYVYLVPSGGGATLGRYDTQGLYGDPASWTTFDLHAVSSSIGFSGATFDGRYIYLVPTDSGVTFRYDAAAPMTSVSSWSTFRISSVAASASSFVGAVSTGRYIYFVPNGGAGGPRGVIARYDAEASFTTGTSWATLDLTIFDATARGYRTGAFDGRYLYLVPGWTAPTPSWATSTIARYDTQATFSSRPSWTFFDTSAVDPRAVGFNAAAFDGQHLILSPGYNGAYHGMTLSVDTKADITIAASWSSFDMSTLGGTPKNLRGESFDGRYVYYAPSSGIAARFDARPFSAGAGLTSVGGSFY